MKRLNRFVRGCSYSLTQGQCLARVMRWIIRNTSVLLLALGLFFLAPALRAETLVSTRTLLDNFFGVNLHLDNCCRGQYENLKAVIDHINYIGATRLRDWAVARPGVFERWQSVYKATGAPFHASIPAASPSHQRIALGVIKDWLHKTPGMIDVIEGGNEEDTPYPKKLGATLADTAALQAEVYVLGRKAGVKVAQLSVGAGWYPPYYEGNYKKFGKPPADYGNAHTYLLPGVGPTYALKRVGNLAAWSVDGKPVDVTEFGFYRTKAQPESLSTAYMHLAPFASYLLGHKYMLVYALHDDPSNAMGFYDTAGKARAHADYWHVTTRLLADAGGKSLPPKTASISFSDQRGSGKGSAGIKNVPMYKSDGSVWIVTYDEVAKVVTTDASQTITFDKTYPVVQVLSGRTGAEVQRLNNARKISVRLPSNHLFFVVAGSKPVIYKP